MPLQSETLLTAGADNASGTHHPGHYIRGVRAARDRLRVEDNVAMAGWSARADQPGGGRSAAAGGAPNRAARTAGGKRAALCAAQAAAPAELRGAGFPS